MKLGNGLWEHTTFNNRLQPTEIGLGLSALVSDQLKLTYEYGTATANNGNLVSQTINVPAIANVRSQLSLKQTYSYDELNRLETAQEKKGGSLQWQQTFKYDRYGNRTFDTTNGQTTPGFEGLNPSISAANNRISKSGYRYDEAGNLTADELGHTYQYDV